MAIALFLLPSQASGAVFAASALTGLSYESNVAWEEARAIWSLWVQKKASIQREFNLAQTVNVTAVRCVAADTLRICAG